MVFDAAENKYVLIKKVKRKKIIAEDQIQSNQ